MSFFKLQHRNKNSRARAGIMRTAHGDIETPIFMPVGTQASVKTLDSTDLENIGAQIILSNNYHLHLRPGEKLISELGGIHKFMNWPRPILTDSGGFQVFSLKHKNTTTLKQPNEDKNNQGTLVKIDEGGVTFRSHLDGSSHRFTPETAMEIEHKIGADIIMAFDECTPDSAPEKYASEAMERTHRWAERSLMAHEKLNSKIKIKKNEDLKYPKNYQRYIFGILQGAKYKNLREKSAKFISSLNFDGVAIGGESIGYNMEATKKILDWVYPHLPENKPHYAMGLGLDPADMLAVIERGVDMFDCVAPTRLARHGMLYVKGEKKNRINIKNAIFAKDTRPVDKTCCCSTCQNYSRAYLHHLFSAQEFSAMRLSSMHNLYVMLNLMREARRAILEDNFLNFKKNWEKK